MILVAVREDDGVEDVGVLVRALGAAGSGESGSRLRGALASYEQDRMHRYEQVRVHSLAVERAADAADYALHYAAFSHWMLAERPGVAPLPRF